MTKNNHKLKTNELTNWLLDTIFPKFCLNCNKEGQYICPDCFNRIKTNTFPVCYKCEKRSLYSITCDKCKQKASLDGIIIANSWEDELLRQIIYEFKYRFIKDLCKTLGQTLINYVKKDYKTLINNNTILAFVPLHKKRQIWRGFNQAELLAREVAGSLNLPLTNLLQRTRNTNPQAEIKSQDKRKNNINQAFILNNNVNLPSFKNKTIILIDDICTTGATLEECAKALKSLKPKEIWGLVLARG